MAGKSYDKYLKKKKFPNPKHRKYEGVAERVSSDEEVKKGNNYRISPVHGGFAIVEQTTGQQVAPVQGVYKTAEEAKKVWEKWNQRRKKSMSKIKNLRMRRKAVEDEEMDDLPPEGDMGMEGMDDLPGDGQFEEGEMDELSDEGEMDDIAPEEGGEKYSAQVLRRLHQDGLILMEEYDDMRGMLENEEVDSLIQKKLETLEEFLEEVEEIFIKFHTDLPGLEGALEEEDLEEVEKIEDDNADSPNELESESDTDERDEDEPSADDAIEGMSKVAEDKAKKKASEKSLPRRPSQLAKSKAYQDYLRWKAAKALKGGKFPSLKKKPGWSKLGQAPKWGGRKKSMCGDCKSDPCKCVGSKKKVFSAPGMPQNPNQNGNVAPQNGQPTNTNLANEQQGSFHKTTHRSPLKNPELKHLEEVKDFMGDVATKAFSDEPMRAKAFHYSKTLFDIAYAGLTEFGKSIDEKPTDLHEDRAKCLEFSKFLDELSQAKDFGDKHRERAKGWHKAKFEGATDKEESDKKKEEEKKKKDKKSQPEAEVKQLLETTEQQSKAMSELAKKLSSLTEHINSTNGKST